MEKLIKIESAAEIEKRKRYKCIIKIKDILGEFDWFYISCPKDNKRLKRQGEDPECSQCRQIYKKTEASTFLRVCVSAQDPAKPTKYIYCTILGKEAEDLLDCSTKDLIDDERIDGIPNMLLKLTGKTFIFTVQYNSAYTLRPTQPTFRLLHSEPYLPSPISQASGSKRSFSTSANSPMIITPLVLQRPLDPEESSPLTPPRSSKQKGKEKEK